MNLTPSPLPSPVNDTHSKLNPTEVRGILRPASVPGIVEAVAAAGRARAGLAIAGGRHAMGGQQFLAGGLLLDLSACARVLAFDRERGLVEVEAGIQWPRLFEALERLQLGDPTPWVVRQKQTGADRFSLGGSLAANVHGRGLGRKPIVDDVEAITIVGADGEIRRASRAENRHLFRLAIGGYGLFGVIATVTLRLERRRTLERVVEILDSVDLPAAFDERQRDGYALGDFQFAIDRDGADFLRRGIFSSYRPVESSAPRADRRALGAREWRDLVHLAHVEPRRAYEEYVRHYVASAGQTYFSDEVQTSVYLDDYHADLDRRLGARVPSTEMITELSVPREHLVRFLESARARLRATEARVIYGTVRLIEPDDETFLSWARGRFACVVFNLCVRHDAAGIAEAARAFRSLIDAALELGGTFYLTYHRFASRAQVERAYPEFRSFLRWKRRLDPEERFASDWYRHWRREFAAVL